MEAAILTLKMTQPKAWNSQRELLKSIVDACSHLDCPICKNLMARIDAMGSDRTRPQATCDSTDTLEAERSHTIRHQFALFTPIHFYSQNVDSSVIFPDAQQLLADYGTCIVAGKQAMDHELNFTINRESQSLSADLVGFVKSMPLRYGLHQLISDVEQSKNHRMVFNWLTPTQLNSLFAQITCEETLWKDVDGDGPGASSALRLLQIERELTDLMARDDRAREAKNEWGNSSVGGSITQSTAAKKSGHETNN